MLFGDGVIDHGESSKVTGSSWQGVEFILLLIYVFFIWSFVL